MSETENKLCPSAPCTEGALLLGVVQGDKTVALLNTTLKVDSEFVQTAKQIGSPEKRFRFANKCVKSGCKQWTGERCGVMDILIEANQNVELDDDLKPCIIREQCRWYSQAGPRACGLCTFVVTNNMEESNVLDVPMPEGL